MLPGSSNGSFGGVCKIQALACGDGAGIPRLWYGLPKWVTRVSLHLGLFFNNNSNSNNSNMVCISSSGSSLSAWLFFLVGWDLT